MAMTERMGRFAAAYLMCGDAKQAALEAGYSPEYARTQAYKLLKHEQVARAIESGFIPEEWSPCHVTEGRAREILSAIVLATPEMFTDEFGNMSVATGGVFKHAIRELTLVEKPDGRSEQKVKLWDKLRALRELRRWNQEDAEKERSMLEGLNARGRERAREGLESLGGVGVGCATEVSTEVGVGSELKPSEETVSDIGRERGGSFARETRPPTVGEQVGSFAPERRPPTVGDDEGQAQEGLLDALARKQYGPDGKPMIIEGLGGPLRLAAEDAGLLSAEQLRLVREAEQKARDDEGSGDR